MERGRSEVTTYLKVARSYDLLSVLTVLIAPTSPRLPPLGWKKG